VTGPSRGPADGAGPAPVDIGFRCLTEADLPLVYAWRRRDFVVEWYGNPPASLADVSRTYLPRIRGEAPTDCYLILDSGLPIGLIQTYMIGDYPEYAEHVGVDEDTAGLDLFIGEAGHIHRGLGPVILRRFLDEVVFPGGAASCVVGPEPTNLAAIRAYEKAGFRHLKTIQLPGEPEPERIMVVTPGDLRRRNLRLIAERLRKGRRS
jgi:RimJ/RimL family protein N-acetyltransferase